jgi:Domain of unknown function (DUF4278)
MKPIYRGVQHTYHLPTLAVTEAEIVASYRGVVYRSQVLRVPPRPQPSYDWLYRGVCYATGENAGEVAVGRLAIAPGSVVTPVKPVVLSPTSPENLARVHDQNLHQNLERRLRSAQDRGDQHLVYLLEAERRQLA